MTEHPPTDREEATPIPVQTIGYARPGATGLPRWQLVVGTASLIVATLFLLVSGGLTILLAGEAIQRHQEIVAIPATVAMYNAANAQRLANYSRRISALQAQVASPYSSPRPSAAAEAAKVIAVIETQSGRKLNPAQVAALTSALEQPGQQLVNPVLPITDAPLTHAPTTLPAQIFSSRSTGLAGGVRVRVFRYYTSLHDRAGAEFELDASGALRVATGLTPTELLAREEQRRLRSEEIMLAAGAAVTAASLALAGVLLAAGIMALRAVPRWMMYHRVYAWCQFAIAALGVLLVAWQSRGNAIGMNAIAITLAACVAFVLYPLVLLGMLPGRR